MKTTNSRCVALTGEVGCDVGLLNLQQPTECLPQLRAGINAVP
jgi:hypothetical protein